MILPNPDQLNRFNKYALVMLAAKRAKQLQEQGIARRALVNSSSQNPLTIALEEIAAGRLIPTFTPEPVPELMEPEPETIPLTHELEEAIARMTAEREQLAAEAAAESSSEAVGVEEQFTLEGLLPEAEKEEAVSLEAEEETLHLDEAEEETIELDEAAEEDLSAEEPADEQVEPLQEEPLQD